MVRNRMMMLYMMMAIFLAVFLYTGLREEVKASGAEDPITLPIDGIICHQQAGELFDEINEERRNRGIQELIWDSGYERIAGIRAIETSVYKEYVFAWGGAYLNQYRYTWLLTPYLATICNLSQAVVKNADKTMKITYTLTEQAVSS